MGIDICRLARGMVILGNNSRMWDIGAVSLGRASCM